MSVVRIIDYTFKIFKSRFMEIGFFAFLVNGSVTIIASVFMTFSIASFLGPFPSLFAASAGYGQDMFPRFFASIIGMLGTSMVVFIITGAVVTPFINTVISVVAYEYYTGAPRRPIKELFKTVIVKFVKIFLTNLLLAAIMSMFLSVIYVLYLIITGVFFAVIFASASFNVIGMIVFLLINLCVFAIAGTAGTCISNIIFSIMGNEDIYYMEAISKAIKFTFSRLWKMMRVFIVIMLLIMALTFSLYLLLLVSRLLLGTMDLSMMQYTMSDPMTYLFIILSLFIGILLMPVMPIATTLFYIDSRIVREGLDLSLRERDLSGDDSSGFSFDQWGGQERGI